MSIGSLFCRLNNEAMFLRPLMRNLDQMLVHNISLKLAKARSPVLLLALLFIQAVERQVISEPSIKLSKEYFLKEK